MSIHELDLTEIGRSKGSIFDIQHYSIHDGPGIRTTVFFSGCPLRCLWCQNPESQRQRPQLMYMQERCAGCGLCVDCCPHHAIRLADGKAKTDRALCTACGLCVHACPNDARRIAGQIVTAQEVFRSVQSDWLFYEDSGGGVTFSGGEALLQPDFAASLAVLCQNAGIHTALETCGYATWQTVRQVLENIDLVLYDFKHMDDGKHRACTGFSNRRILENATKIVRDLGKPFWARIPVIPGYNDDAQNMSQTARFIASELGTAVKVFLLPYHRLGEGKRAELDLENQGFASIPPDDEQMARLQNLFEQQGLTAQIGG